MAKVAGEPEIPHETFWRIATSCAFAGAVVTFVPAALIFLREVLTLGRPVAAVERFGHEMLVGVSEYTALWQERRAYRIRHCLTRIEGVFERSESSAATNEAIDGLRAVVVEYEKIAAEARRKAAVERAMLPWQRRRTAS